MLHVNLLFLIFAMDTDTISKLDITLYNNDYIGEVYQLLKQYDHYEMVPLLNLVTKLLPFSVDKIE